MNASISVVCYKSKTLSNGEHPLMLQISKDRNRKYQSLGISVKSIHWNFKKNQLKTNCPNYKIIQKIILDKQAEIHRNALELHSTKEDYTVNALLKPKEPTVTYKTVGEFYLSLISGYETMDKRGNRRVYKGSYNSIKTFSKGKLNFQFNDIDTDWLKKYEQWLRSKENKETTISLLFRTLRSAYNKAIEAKIVKRTAYPFDEYKLNKFDVSTEKRAISKEDIHKIRNVDLSKELFYTCFSRDLFMFTYFCAGINLTDIANLDCTNIVNNRLYYIRQKTGKKINVLLNAESWVIIQKYSGNKKDNYLFPILDKNIHVTATQIENRIHKVLAKVNKGLKEVAKLAGVNVNLTTYVARHAYASVLKKSGVSIALIGETLGHSDLKTTSVYLDSFENSQIDEAMKNLL